MGVFWRKLTILSADKYIVNDLAIQGVKVSTGRVANIEMILFEYPQLTIRGLDINGLVQERGNSSALAMDLHLSCSNPSIYCRLCLNIPSSLSESLIYCRWCLNIPSSLCDFSLISPARYQRTWYVVGDVWISPAHDYRAWYIVGDV